MGSPLFPEVKEYCPDIMLTWTHIHSDQMVGLKSRTICVKKSRLKIAEVVFTRQMKDFDLFKIPQQFGPNKCTHRLQIVAQNCNKSPNLVTLHISLVQWTSAPFSLLLCGQPRPLIHLFSIFSNKQNHFYNKNQCEKYLSILPHWD